MNLQEKINEIMQYEDIYGIICVAAIIIFVIMALTSKKKTDTKGGFSLLTLCIGAFVVLFVVCNFGGDAV